MTAEQEKWFAALQTIKEMCADNFNANDNCDCPCCVDGACALAEGYFPKAYNLRSSERVVFFE